MIFDKFINKFYNTPFLRNTLIKALVLISISLVFAIILGIIISNLNNMSEIEKLLETKKPAMPSTLYDRNGEVITTYYSDEKRELITLDMVPEHLVKGLILYEDEGFYHHKGFNLFAIIRAALNNLVGRPVSGASTLTQQLARTLFLTNRFTWGRKFKELWIAIQLEKKFTKNEILTLYLNHVPFGYGTNGVESASKFYFNKNIEDLTYAESSSLITLISNPTHYSFIRFPKNHERKQREVLKKMVKSGIITEVEAEKSLSEFWMNWQTTTQSSRGAFFNREDRAPFFSDWVLNEIQNELPNVDIFRDGLKIYSTLDANWNSYAQKLMQKVLERQQKIFEENQIVTYNVVQKSYLYTLSLMTDAFSLTNINLMGMSTIKLGLTDANKDLMPPLNLTSQMLGLNMVDIATEIMLNKEESKDLLAQVQGAFVLLDNQTGQILVMFGGKKFDPNNRFNIAMQGRRQPGSSFKPLYYSAAFDTKIFTPATVVIDKPLVFKNYNSEDPEDWYSPFNYGGNFYGPVTLRRALRRSLNIPSCIVFDTIGKNNGYKVPIDRAALLLGINSDAEIEKRFDPVISTALGTCSVSPIEMATAYLTFATMGKRRLPNCILKIEDADGKVIYNPWKDMEKYYRENDKKLQIITPQNAFLMTSILKDVVSSPDGTLAWAKQLLLNQGKKFPVALAGKTGTSQNWSDGWSIIYSPYVTSIAWVGFEKYGLSLGNEQACSVILGPTSMEFMQQYHENMPVADFTRVDGVASARICKNSGLRPSEYCAEGDLYYENFLPGTVPMEICNYCQQKNIRAEKNYNSFLDAYEKKYNDASFDKLLEGENIEVDNSILNKYKSTDEDLDLKNLNDVDLNIENMNPENTNNNNNKQNNNNNITNKDNTNDTLKDP